MRYLYHLRFRRLFAGEGGCKRRAELWRARGKMKKTVLLNGLWTRGAARPSRIAFSYRSCPAAAAAARVDEFFTAESAPKSPLHEAGFASARPLSKPAMHQGDGLGQVASSKSGERGTEGEWRSGVLGLGLAEAGGLHVFMFVTSQRRQQTSISRARLGNQAHHRGTHEVTSDQRREAARLGTGIWTGMFEHCSTGASITTWVQLEAEWVAGGENRPTLSSSFPASFRSQCIQCVQCRPTTGSLATLEPPIAHAHGCRPVCLGVSKI